MTPSVHDNTKLAWVAGFLEGDGFFRFAPGGTRKSGPLAGTRYAGYAVIGATQNDREALDRVAEVLGGHVAQTSTRTRPVTWRWQLGGVAAIPAMERLRPLMTRRRQRQIDAALEAAAEYGKGRGKAYAVGSR